MGVSRPEVERPLVLGHYQHVLPTSLPFLPRRSSSPGGKAHGGCGGVGDSVSLSCKFFQKSFNGPRSCPRMSASALVAGDAGGVAFYHFLRVDVVMLSSSSSGSRHVGSCAPSPRPKDGTGTSSFPHIGSQETAGKGLRAGAGKAAIANVFQRVATVWQINVILTDVSVCSTNKAEPCVPHFFSPLFLCI